MPGECAIRSSAAGDVVYFSPRRIASTEAPVRARRSISASDRPIAHCPASTLCVATGIR
jgi:hypothetical protein